MPLDPGDITKIGEAVAAAYGPYALAGVLLAIFAGVVIALKITAPEARRLTIAEMKDPEGEVAKMRAEERSELLSELRDEVDALDAITTLRVADLETRFIGKIDGLPKPDIKSVEDRLTETKNALAPLLQTVDLKNEAGETLKANAVLYTLDQVINLANALVASMFVEIEIEGEKKKVNVLQNIELFIERGIDSYQTSEEARGMAGRSKDAKARAREEAAQAMAEAAKMAADPEKRAELEEGAELATLKDIVVDIAEKQLKIPEKYTRNPSVQRRAFEIFQREQAASGGARPTSSGGGRSNGSPW